MLKKNSLEKINVTKNALCSTRSMDSLTVKSHNFFQNKNRKATHNFAPRTLIFKLRQEV